ncbi:MAG: hypothetical protein RLZZ352_2756 [Pseudomonadota bacterium]|jgi:hypothetical protein
MTPSNLCVNNSEYVQSFKNVAKWVWEKTESAYQHGISLNEETITGMILLMLAEKLKGKGLSVKSYTKAEEGRKIKKNQNTPTGADWSFWFQGRDGKGKELRIQAKRLFASGKYESLDNKKFRSQTHQLIKSSQKVGAIPLYVFYNGRMNNINPNFNLSYCCEAYGLSSLLDRNSLGVIESDVIDRVCCELIHPIHSSLTGILDISINSTNYWGCAFVSAHLVPKKSKPTPKDIPMIPWHCMFCSAHGKGGEQSLPEMVIQSIKHLYSNNSSEDFSERLWSLDEPQPEWVGLLNSLNDNGNERIDQKLKSLGLKGVALFQEI